MAYTFRQQLAVILIALTLLGFAFWLAGCGSLGLTQQARQETVKQEQAATGASSAAVEATKEVQGEPTHQPQPNLGSLRLDASGRESKITLNINVVTSQPADDGSPSGQPYSSKAGVRLGTKQQGTTSSSFFSEGKVTVSLTVIGYAVGIGLIAVVFYFIIQGVKKGAFGAGAQAAGNVADAKLADIINTHSSAALTATDPAAKIAALAALAAAEKARGQTAYDIPTRPAEAPAKP